MYEKSLLIFCFVKNQTRQNQTYKEGNDHGERIERIF